jgi:hypothetical protein
MDAKKLKLIVRGDKKPTFGTDPNEPWSVRAGITESERGELHAYLKSRGINPDFVSKDTKISHAKSSEFHKWRRDHQFDDPINFVSTTVADRMKKQRAQTEEVEIEEGKTLQHTPVELRQHAIDKEKHMTKVLHHNGLHKEESEQIDELAPETLASYVLKTTSKDPKRAEPRKKAMGKLAKIMAKRSFSEAKTIQGTALDKFRQAAADRARKHDDIEREMKARHAAGKEDMKGSIDRLEKQLNKEEKDKKEYDYEGEMVKSDLRSIMANAQRIHDMLEDNDNLPEWVQSKITVAEDYVSTAANYLTAEMSEEVDQIDEKNVPTSPEKWARAKAAAKSKFDVYPSAYANGWASKKYKAMGGDWKSVKEETEQLDEVSSSEVDHHFHQWTNSEHAPYNSDAGDDNKVHQSALGYLRSTNVPKEKHEKLAMHIAHKFHGSGIDEASGISKEKETKFHKKLDTLVHSTFGKRKDEMKMKEEVEQIDELKKSTVFSWLKQQPVVPEKKPGMSRKDHNQKIKSHNKSWNRALDRLSGYKPTSEDVFQDTQAATQTAFDMGTQADDREPTHSKKKEMSKSARMIKSLYRKHKMVKEELYDHEKEDKSVATYGKKPKTEKQEVYGDDDAQAAMILKGGTTLTGQTRDTLEIDPVMRKPVRPDNKISNKKTDK